MSPLTPFRRVPPVAVLLAVAAGGAVSCAEPAEFSARGPVVESAVLLSNPEPERNPCSGEPMLPRSPHCNAAGVIDSETRFERRLPPR